MSDVLLAEYGVNKATLHLSSTTFNPGAEKYHIRWNVKFNDQEQFWEYELTPTTNQIPALRFGYRNMDQVAPPVYYFISVAPAMMTFCDLIVGASTGVNTGIDITSPVLINSGGASFITNPNWNGFSQALVGTVSNSMLDITIAADFPIFCTDWALDTDVPKTGDAYECTSISDDNDRVTNCVSGDMSDIEDAENYTDVVDTIPQDKIYFIKNAVKKNGTVVDGKHYRFKIPPDAKIWLVKSDHDNTGLSTNMKLHMKNIGVPPTYMLMDMEASTPTWSTEHTFITDAFNYYWGEWTDYSNGDWYKVIGNSYAGYTNIPVFRSDTLGDKYGDGEIGEDMAENAGEGGGDGNITTGDDLDSSDVPNVSIAGSGVCCNVWLLSKSNLNTISNILHDDDQTLIEDIKKGTWLWGNNPIDFIISIYYVPFDVSNFYDTTSSNLYFGNYDTGESFTRVLETKSAGQRAVLVDTSVDQIYGDWRDIDFFKYDLYLPYIGFVPLDSAVYVGHQLKIELAFDVMTHNIRYYLYCDGILTDRVDGSVGYSIPLTGTDQVNKANNNLNGIIATAKGGLEAGVGVMTGNLASVGSGALNTFNGVRQMMQYPREIIRGDISASMNIFDINYVYLKVTEKQAIYPTEIRQVYNNPSYVCCKLSDLSGYCELQDVQLKSSCTEVEYAEILQLLKEGVIF